MPSAQRYRSDDPEPATTGSDVDDSLDKIWPLDLAVAALAILITAIVATRLDWNDPRWMFNARTYLIGVPMVALALDLILRTVATRFVGRSMQVAFLVSVFVHLCLLLLAVNVVLFSRLWPDPSPAPKPDSEPLRRTIADYFIQESEIAESEQAQWERPTEAAPEERPLAPESRQFAPRQTDTSRLSATQELPAEQPDSSDRPPPLQEARLDPIEIARAAERKALDRAAAQPDGVQVSSNPTAPDVPATRETEDVATLDAMADDLERAESQSLQPPLPQPAMSSRPQPNLAPLIAARSDQPLPQVDPAIRRPLNRRVAPSTGGPQSSPSPVATPPSLQAFESQSGADPAELPAHDFADSAERPLSRGAASATTPQQPRTSPAPSLGSASAADLVRAPPSGGDAPRVAAAPQRESFARRSLSLGPPPAADNVDALANAATPSASGAAEETGPSLGTLAGDPAPRREVAGATPTANPTSSTAQERIDIGRGQNPLATTDRPSNSEQTPRIASSEGLQRRRFQRRDLSTDIRPPTAGQQAPTLGPFRRRLSRTSGGAMPIPPGSVGPETEAAIELGLQYLASHQNDDGSWSLQETDPGAALRSNTAATGLSLLAFQGAGYTHREHQYASTVARALAYLQRNQRPDGDLFVREDPTSNQNVALYSHGIAALALCEAYGMTEDPQLQESAQRALDFIAASQHPLRGGWRYQPGISSDTSVTGWMMMALKSGQLAGLEVDPETYEGIDRWLRLSQDSPSRPYLFRYNPYAPDTPSQRHGREVTPTMTAVGLLMRMYSGWDRNSRFLQQGAGYLLENPPQIGTLSDPERDTYYWYYATQVMFHMGGDYWQKWNGQLHPLLIRSQITEGAQAGSWDPIAPVPDRWAPHAGRLYVTAMNLLNLEVYYRHLPIYEETRR